MATENEVKITRPIHGEAGLFSIDEQPDGGVLLHGQTAKDTEGYDLTFTAEEFATLGALIARVRKAKGSAKPAKGAAKKTGARRGRKPAADAASAPEAPLANGAVNGAAPVAGVDEPVV